MRECMNRNILSIATFFRWRTDEIITCLNNYSDTEEDEFMEHSLRFCFLSQVFNLNKAD